jgi:peptidoglycan/LPS O-acetylase OafA/YrhL
MKLTLAGRRIRLDGLRSARASLKGESKTLAEVFDPRHNSLNALRLALATLVIVSHAWPIGGFGEDPKVGDLSLGGWAVAGFFAISGFLITGSRLRSSFSSYLWRRMLRIFPGLWICLLVTVVVFVPIAALLEGGADHVGPSSLVGYLAPNGVLESGHQNIAGTLSGVPYPGAWNGSLWTLWFEFGCYLVLGGLLVFSGLRRRPAVLAGVFAACALVNVAQAEFGMQLPFRVEWAVDLGSYFFAGAVLCVYANRIPASRSLVAISTAILAAAALTDHVQAVGALPLAFLLIWLGCVLPLQAVGRRNDISYGVYIYAFPVQQLLVLAGAAALGAWAYAGLCILCTVPLAALSWFFVEERAMRLKRITPPWTAMRHRLAPQGEAEVPQEAV